MNARITLRILDKEHQDCSLNTFNKLRSKYSEARYAIDDHGNPTGNEGSWRGFEEDLKSFTLQEPGLHLQLDITADYGEPYVNRFYFYGGGMQKCKPELVYPPIRPNEARPAAADPAEGHGAGQGRWQLGRAAGGRRGPARMDAEQERPPDHEDRLGAQVVLRPPRGADPERPEAAPRRHLLRGDDGRRLMDKERLSRTEEDGVCHGSILRRAAMWLNDEGARYAR
jgi:hypothetical protein